METGKEGDRFLHSTVVERKRLEALELAGRASEQPALEADIRANLAAPGGWRHKTEGLWLNHDIFRRRTRSQLKVQLAKALGVSQQTVQAYEVSRRRIPVSTLRLLAKTLDVSLDELMAEGEHAPRKRGPVPQVQRQLERISALPKPKQRAVMDVIEALLAQQGR